MSRSFSLLKVNVTSGESFKSLGPQLASFTPPILNCNLPLPPVFNYLLSVIVVWMQSFVGCLSQRQASAVEWEAQ
jgi:hypothetical protein